MEYCVVDRCTGAVVNMITSSRSIDDLRERNETYEYRIVPVNAVSYNKLQQYRYWNERP